MYFNTALSRKKSTVDDISIYGPRDGGIDNYHLSEELYTFTALKTLYISADFLALSPSIAQLQNLESLYINSRLIKKLPVEIGQLKNLKTLSISGQLFQHIPDSIAQLSSLKRLSFRNCPLLTTLPHSLQALPQLTSLSLYQSKWDDLTAFEQGFAALRELWIDNAQLTDAHIRPILQLHNLTTLSLSNHQLTAIPEALLHFQQLASLSVAGNQIQHIPDFIGQLSQLQRLRFENNQVQQFPVFLKHLPQLNSLGWQNNAFGKYDKALLDFPTAVTNPYSKAAESAKYQTFIEQVKACNFSHSVLDLFFAIQNGNALEKGKFKRADFLALLDYPVKSFKSTIINQLLDYEQERLQAQPLSPQSALVVLGKTTLSKSEIRATLKEQGISYQTKIAPTTTHLLVGDTGIKDYSIFHNEAYILISQQAFQEFVNNATKPYLLEEEFQGNLEHIASLLSSHATKNQQLGIELLKGGGTPKELLTELFIVYKFSEDKKLAAKAKKLLSNNASATLLEKLKLRIQLRGLRSYTQSYERIEKLTAGTELQTWKVAQYACLNHPIIWEKQTFLGLKEAPKEAAQAFLVQMVRNTLQKGNYQVMPSLLPYLPLLYQSCDFIEGLKFIDEAQGLDGISALSQLKRVVFYFTKQTIVPKDLHLLPQLEEVSFTSTALSDWGVVLHQLSKSPSLKRLVFWSSMRTGIHPNMAQLQQLNYLSFTNTLLKEKDLALLAQLPQLKTVAFSNTSANLDDNYTQLQQVAEFYFNQGEPYEVTANFSKLQQLKKLVLKGPFSIQGSLVLPQLEHLYLESHYRSKQAVLPENINQLTSLKTLEIRGAATNLHTVLPQFQQLEHLTIMHNQIEIEDLIAALQQLPQLKTLKRYFSSAQSTLVQQALPHLTLKK